jgi:hypothetical protein
MPNRQQVLSDFRTKYPRYKDVPDDALAASIGEKFPSYKEFLANDPVESGKRLSRNKEMEDVIGGQLVDPETGQVAYSDDQRAKDKKTLALAALEENQKRLAEENEGLELDRGSNKLTSAAMGAASVPIGIANLAEIGTRKGLQKFGGEIPPEIEKMLSSKEKQAVLDQMEASAGANPVTAGISSGIVNAASMGGPGGTVGLLRQGAIKEATKQATKDAVVNMTIGEGLRRVTGGDTEKQDVILDAILGGLGGGRNKPAEEALINTAEKVGSFAKPLADASKEGAEKLRDSGLGASRWIQKEFEKRAINVGAKKAQEEAIEKLADEAVTSASNKATGSNSITYNPKDVKEVTKKFLSTGKDIEENLQLQRDANLAINSTSGELNLLNRMIKEGEEHAVDFDKRNPQLTVGEEFLKRAEPLKKLRSQYGKELAQSVKDIPKDALVPKFEDVTVETPEGPATQRIIKNPGVDPRSAVLKRMNGVSELEGLTMDSKGNLDFSETSLRGKRSEAMRKQIQNDFDEIVDATPGQLHKKRQELFDEVSKVDYKARGATEKGMNAMRQGLADVLEQVSPKYKELNQKVATLIEPADELASLLKLSDETKVPTDFLENEAGLLARRLTSNAPSNPRIGALLDQIEKRLGEEGIKFDTRLPRVQQMYNMLNRYFPEITTETSLQGQVRNANIPTSKSGVANAILDRTVKDFGTSPSVRKKYLKDLINSLR